MSKAFSQCGTAVFTSPSTGCINQRIPVTNNSSAGNYFWDFCTGDFLNTPTSQALYSLSSAVGRPAIELIYDGASWYSFVTGTWSNTLYRLIYGNGPGSNPTVIDNLGDLSGKLNGPGPIRIIRENNQWFGVVYNTSSGELLKLSFGNNLANPVSATVLYTNTPYGNAGLALGRDASNGWTCILSNVNTLSIIRLGNSLTSPSGGDIIISSPIPNPNNFADVDLINVCGQWTAMGTNLGNANVYRFDFGTNLFSSPAITQIATIPVNNPGRLRIAQDGENYFTFVSSMDGILTKLGFGNNLTSSPTITNEGNMGVLSNMYGLAVANDHNSTWIMLSVSLTNGQVFSINYPDNCSASPRTSTSTIPTFSYSSQGNYNISLMNSNSTGIVVKTNPITINSLTAPDITFTPQNICAKNNINFTSTNVSGNISSYAWAFGDGGTSAAANPSYIYTSAGVYWPALTVTASNGCQNMAQDSLRVFNPPQANFLLPPASPICTNQNYTFTNTSTSDVGSNPSWQWSVNGSNISTSQNLNYVLSTTAAQTISLTASLPGCSTQSTQNISTVLAGPSVSFTSAITGCVASSVSFTNTTSGSVTGYTWLLGDGNTSTQTNAAHAYLGTGTYVATLNATNAAGCQNSFSKNISIYSNPQPKFSIETPPFSCANYPAQFDNNTGFLSDSNITLWQWSFGDAANGSSSAKSPAYTFSAAGNYNVSLKATTNFGCTAIKDSVIAILASPQAGFTNAVACLNQSTQFTSTSTGSIVSYKWYFPGLSNPVTGASPGPQVFTSSGANSVSLVVTATNGCINTFTKSINVPVPPVVDFSIQYPCTRNATVFQELNPGGSDPTVSWNWNFGSATTTGSPATYKFSSSGGYGVTLTTTRQSGCVYSVTKNVSIYDGPVASFTPSVIAGAAPLPVTFNNTSTADSYGWQFGDAANSTSAVPSPTFTYSQLGEYKVRLTANNVIGCRDTMSVWISVVIPKPSATLKIFSLIPSSSANSSQPYLSVFNSGNVPLVNPEVDIDLGGGGKVKQTLSGLIQPQGTLSQILNLQILTGSLSYVCAQVVVPQDVNPDYGKQCLTLQGDVVFEPYPNPASGAINLDWIATSNENVEITLFKSDGTIAFQQSFSNQPAGLTQFSLPTTPLANGLYLIRFSGATIQKTFRVAITN
ncbi:MAG: PKD domain-containing protein [Bacteroidetes bacterium]|nr:PKD domain-containing protein [Bacteroidota bacterium]